LKSWISQRSKSGASLELRDDTPILAEGILSSLDVVELVLFIENLRGAEVDADQIQPEALVDIDSIYETFFDGD
jgi:acyl carrier protein